MCSSHVVVVVLAVTGLVYCAVAGLAVCTRLPHSRGKWSPHPNLITSHKLIDNHTRNVYIYLQAQGLLRLRRSHVC